jgi:hypothetical protein
MSQNMSKVQYLLEIDCDDDCCISYQSREYIFMTVLICGENDEEVLDKVQRFAAACVVVEREGRVSQAQEVASRLKDLAALTMHELKAGFFRSGNRSISLKVLPTEHYTLEI